MQIKDAKRSRGREVFIGLLHKESAALGKKTQAARQYAYDYRKCGSVRSGREINRLLGVFPAEKALTAVIRQK
jgi:hypothetical protein